MWTQKPPPASITNHLLLWMNVMFDFICIGFAMRNAKKATNSKWKWMSLAGIKPAWIKKATRCNIGIKLIMVRYILELTVRQNLHFFYQCRCNLLLFTELGMNTRNHNTFDKCIGKCWFYSYAVISVKLLNRVYHLSVWPGDLRHQFGKRLVAGSIPAGDVHFHCEFFAFFAFLIARRSPYKWNQA